MSKKLAFLLLFITTFCFSQNTLPLIPQPKSIQIAKGHFTINKETVIQADGKMFEAYYLQQCIKQQTGLDLKILPVASKVSKISLSRAVDAVTNDSKESYKLNISNNTVAILAEHDEGILYGVQTLLQLIPTETKTVVELPCLQIDDQPKYAWRGMHLDCARHFFPVSFVKKYIDYLAMYKFNTFHWHLTDDQGWRIEIKQYPKLTEVGAWRNGSMVGHYNQQTYDTIRYGGFYTQEDIKDVVAYATQHHITVIPEIEMPGHAVAALAAYPEYSCTGGPFEVAKQWGVLDDVFCPKEETFTFLENILTEVMELFPSEYIHIGGDECPKTRWKTCPHCQALIKEKGLKDEHELQSYFIQRIEKFVNSKGRKIIGWDEILEGGLAPNAAVMSWRGTEGGITAAKQHHYVVMTPGSHCYFDHYQGDPKNEPLAIGGYLPLDKVYSFNPTPKKLSQEESKYILGAQGNVWTEYIYTTENVEYMIFPRMMALSEVLWGTANPDKYADFQSRLIQQFPVLTAKGINFSRAIFEVTANSGLNESGNGILVTLKSAGKNNNIRYTTDGKVPSWDSNSYINPIDIDKNQTIKAAYFENGKQQSAVMEQLVSFNKATGKKITLVNPPGESYATGGAFTLVDGVFGNRSVFGKGWLGFAGKDLNAVIDLMKPETVSKVTISLLESQSSWIYYPNGIEVLVSNDGQNFQSIQKVSLEDIKAVKGEVTINFTAQQTQYVKIIATNTTKIAEGKPGAGSAAWLFADEIGVE